jgi:hypothetical protein
MLLIAFHTVGSLMVNGQHNSKQAFLRCHIERGSGGTSFLFRSGIKDVSTKSLKASSAWLEEVLGSWNCLCLHHDTDQARVRELVPS